MPRYDETHPDFPDLEVFEVTRAGGRKWHKRLRLVKWVDTDHDEIGEYRDERLLLDDQGAVVGGVMQSGPDGLALVFPRYGVFFVRHTGTGEVNP